MITFFSFSQTVINSGTVVFKHHNNLEFNSISHLPSVWKRELLQHSFVCSFTFLVKKVKTQVQRLIPKGEINLTTSPSNYYARKSNFVETFISVCALSDVVNLDRCNCLTILKRFTCRCARATPHYFTPHDRVAQSVHPIPQQQDMVIYHDIERKSPVNYTKTGRFILFWKIGHQRKIT